MSEKKQSHITQNRKEFLESMDRVRTSANQNVRLFNNDVRLIKTFGGKVNLAGIDSPALDLKEYYVKLDDMLTAIYAVLRQPGLELSDSIKYNNMKNEIIRAKAEISANVWSQQEQDKMLRRSRDIQNIDMLARMEMEEELSR